VADTGIQIKRHFRKLPAKDMDEVVDIVADVIVRFLKAEKKATLAETQSPKGNAEERRDC